MHPRPYRKQVRQKLPPEDKIDDSWLTEHLAVPDQGRFLDDDHFWLDGQVNSRNAVHWGSATPDKVLTKPLHSQKVTAWMVMNQGIGLVEPFFFEDEHGMMQAVNAERYLDTALRPFWREIKGRNIIDMKRVWMQQDGATPHTARKSMAWLQEHFPGRLISLKADVEWTPHSPDLIPLVWGYLKDRVYKQKSRTTDALENKITGEVAMHALRDGRQNRQSPADRVAAGADPPEGGSHRSSALMSCHD